MRIARRVVLGLLVVVLAWVGWTAWNAWQLREDLTRAEATADRLADVVESEDTAQRQALVDDLGEDAASAADRTDGPAWRVLTWAPFVGDDAEGLRRLSSSLDTVANDGLPPLLTVLDDLDGVTEGGGIDIDKVRAIQEPVRAASAAFAAADAEVSGQDSSGFVSQVRDRFDDYVSRVGDLSRNLESGRTTTDLLPGLLGGDGPRDYLLVFQNNAEVRATGGIPGSWAEVHAEDGELVIRRQGSSASFGSFTPPSISDAEREVYNDIFAAYWQNATMTPSWPRAADLMRTIWEETYAPTELDGVLSLDPVAMSYLLDGSSPVEVGGAPLTAANAVERLLSEPYLTLEPAEQDAFFAEATRALFGSFTGSLTDPLAFVQGLQRAVDERRFLLTSYTDAEADALADFDITGVVPSDDGSRPHVLVGLTDATASKMSYYLRYDTSVTASGCADGVQTLAGQMSLSQTIPAAEAASLPIYVRGPGDIGIPAGSQLVVVRLYSPTGGTVSDVAVAGEPVDLEAIELDGRSVVTVIAQLDGSAPVPVTWTMTTGAGQDGAGQVRVTPGIEPTSEDSTFASAC